MLGLRTAPIPNHIGNPSGNSSVSSQVEPPSCVLCFLESHFLLADIAFHVLVSVSIMLSSEIIYTYEIRNVPFQASAPYHLTFVMPNIIDTASGWELPDS